MPSPEASSSTSGFILYKIPAAPSRTESLGVLLLYFQWHSTRRDSLPAGIYFTHTCTHRGSIVRSRAALWKNTPCVREHARWIIAFSLYTWVEVHKTKQLPGLAAVAWCVEKRWKIVEHGERSCCIIEDTWRRQAGEETFPRSSADQVRSVINQGLAGVQVWQFITQELKSQTSLGNLPLSQSRLALHFLPRKNFPI